MLEKPVCGGALKMLANVERCKYARFMAFVQGFIAAGRSRVLDSADSLRQLLTLQIFIEVFLGPDISVENGGVRDTVRCFVA